MTVSPAREQERWCVVAVMGHVLPASASLVMAMDSRRVPVLIAEVMDVILMVAVVTPVRVQGCRKSVVTPVVVQVVVVNVIPVVEEVL